MTLFWSHLFTFSCILSLSLSRWHRLKYRHLPIFYYTGDNFIICIRSINALTKKKKRCNRKRKKKYRLTVIEIKWNDNLCVPRNGMISGNVLAFIVISKWKVSSCIRFGELLLIWVASEQKKKRTREHMALFRLGCWNIRIVVCRFEVTFSIHLQTKHKFGVSVIHLFQYMFSSILRGF